MAEEIVSTPSTVTTTTSAPAPPEPVWAKPGIGIFNGAMVVVALAACWILKNENGLLLIIGAIISNWNQVISYFFGSSSGSARKTEALTTTQGPPR